MSRYRDVEHRMHSLDEISGIMRSMKALSLMETRKLTGFLESQQRVVQTVERMAADFGQHYPLSTGGRPTDQGRHIFLLIGSERGFCGDFNDALIAAVDEDTQHLPPEQLALIAVGHKLHARLEGDPRLAATAAAPVVAEEVRATLTHLVGIIADLQRGHGDLRLTALHHDMDRPGLRRRPVLPPFEQPSAGKPLFAFPPRLNLAPERFLGHLVDEYLFSILNEIFYTSMMAENHRRVQHLDGALDRLERETHQLTVQRNRQRQEEITEEIEIIMLNTGAVGPAHPDSADAGDPWRTGPADVRKPSHRGPR
ncbi:MAG: F0F1 ATP synthase subunit gamma [Gammaproteobacteria bacterium]